MKLQLLLILFFVSVFSTALLFIDSCQAAFDENYAKAIYRLIGCLGWCIWIGVSLVILSGEGNKNP